MHTAVLPDVRREGCAGAQPAADDGATAPPAPLRPLADIAAAIAHDFGGPLTSIAGLADLLLRTLACDAPGRSDIESIRKAAGDMERLLERLRAFGRTTPADEAPVSVDPASLVACTAEGVRSGQRRRPPGTACDVCVKVTPGASVRVRRAEILELLGHLAQNAVEAMPTGGLLTLRCRDVGARVRIDVTDEGSGMPKETRKRLFQPLFTTKEGHLGLGLARSRGIAERHGASIDLVTRPGSGSTFTILLPAEASADVTVAARGPGVGDAPDQGRGHVTHQMGSDAPDLARAQVNQVWGEAPASPSPRRFRGPTRVLLVDDDEDVLAVVGSLVVALGYELETACDAEAALARLDARPVDVLLTDLVLPGVDGRELARRARQRAPSLRVILLTGWFPETGGQLPAGISRVVLKPVTLQGLASALA